MTVCGDLIDSLEGDPPVGSDERICVLTDDDDDGDRVVSKYTDVLRLGLMKRQDRLPFLYSTLHIQ